MNCIPIPEKLAKALEQGLGSNASLYFSRMTSWTEGQNTKLKAESKGRPAIMELEGAINKRLQKSKPVLERIHNRQEDILKIEANRGTMVWELYARLRSPYVSGLGSGHPTETGMILDRNSGMPYIPASTVKGVLRLACALHIAAQEPEAVIHSNSGAEVPDNHPLLQRFFGDVDTSNPYAARGQLVFLDAFPADIPTIKPDIMTPHYGKYYAGEAGPLDTEEPTPINFLTVAPQTEFIFRCFVSPLSIQKQTDDSVPEEARGTALFNSNDEQTVIDLFNRGFNDLGFGGKTAIGYGRFDLSRDYQEELVQKRYPWRKHLPKLEQATTWGDLQQAMDALTKWLKQKEVAEVLRTAAEKIRANFRKNWTPERDSQISKWLAPAGLTWTDSTTAGPTGKEPFGSPNRITEAHFNNYGDWDSRHPSLGLTIEKLNLAEAEALLTLFKGWGLDNKKSWKKAPAKKKWWQKLGRHIKQLTETG